MYTNSDISFRKDKVTISRWGKAIYVKSYPYSQITPASKSRLENLQFGHRGDMLCLFTLDNTEVFTVIPFKGA